MIRIRAWLQVPARRHNVCRTSAHCTCSTSVTCGSAHRRRRRCACMQAIRQSRPGTAVTACRYTPPCADQTFLESSKTRVTAWLWQFSSRAPLLEVSEMANSDIRLIQASNSHMANQHYGWYFLFKIKLSGMCRRISHAMCVYPNRSSRRYSRYSRTCRSRAATSSGRRKPRVNQRSRGRACKCG